MRLREYSEKIPKPMVNVGNRPILWNVMKYYAHFGHKDFILCLGHQADVIKQYFLNYSEYISNDFVFSEGGKKIKLLNSDIQDWKISFVYTGIHANIGQRLKAAEKYLQGEDVFLANYSDGLSDLPLSNMIKQFMEKNKIASFLCVKPTQSFHVVKLKEEDSVAEIKHISQSEIWINGGFFIFKKEIFNYIKDGEELVEEPFKRLNAENNLCGYKYNGFWVSMDTFKDKQILDDMYAKGKTPWAVWNNSGRNKSERAYAEVNND